MNQALHGGSSTPEENGKTVTQYLEMGRMRLDMIDRHLIFSRVFSWNDCVGLIGM